MAGNSHKIILPSQSQIDHKEKITANFLLTIKEHGFTSIDQFKEFVGKIKSSYKWAAITLAKSYLQEYEQKINQKEQAFKNENYIDQLYSELQPVITYETHQSNIEDHKRNINRYSYDRGQEESKKYSLKKLPERCYK